MKKLLKKVSVSSWIIFFVVLIMVVFKINSFPPMQLNAHLSHEYPRGDFPPYLGGE